ncbi:MAG: ATP-dependent helicase [Thermoplasmatales archaeon]|nr:ATP-dependent helicase [Thermoplasmatales archaeon]
MRRADREYSMDEVMGLMEPLVSRWFSGRFSSLTEPQSKAIPLIHGRENVLVSSPTGSGKTLTAFTSIINELVKYSSEGGLEEKVYCVYVSPLKALANDVNRNLNEPLTEMEALAGELGMPSPGIRVGVRSGDTSQYERQKMLRKPPHILITTPESLALMLEAPKFKERLSGVEWLILDEIHDICDSKRGAFLSLAVERLQKHCGRPFARIGLSATLAPMEAIAGFLVGYEDGRMRDVVFVESDTKKDLDLEVICPTDDMTALSSDIVNSMMYDRLKELVDEHVTTLVFTNTRSGAESVVYKLKERGMESIEVHHSSLGKETRLDVEERLKAGELKCVVSSTSLELGIDIGSVDLVCQIGSPKSVAKGLQRVGRSGHGVGQTAKGRLLVFDPDDLVECAVMCRAAHRGDIDRVAIPENCLDVLAQALVGMSLGERWDVDDAFGVVRSAYCYRNLPREKFVNVLRYLGSKDEFEGVYSKIWYDEDENTFGRKRGSRMIYFMNLGTIPEEANYRVITAQGSMAGELSEKFVERLAPGDIFVLGGRSLEFVRSKGMTAYVKEASGRKPTVPSWVGEMLPRSFDLSMDVARFRREMAGLLEGEDDEIMGFLSEDFGIDRGSARTILSYFREQKAVTGFIPDDEELSIEEYIDPSGNQRLVFHFPFGRRVNDALSRAYAYRITNAVGANVSVTVSDDNFMIGTPRKIDPAKVPGMLREADLETILRKAVRHSEIFKQRFRHTASRSFMILRNYKGRSVSVARQQTRSSFLLEAMGDMENMPIIEETYREILEDDMDIRNASGVLSAIENGGMAVRIVPYDGTPSPFAHSAILSGFSDIVLMEDRSALLRELHRKVLSRAMGDEIREFEFDEDAVVPYFREKIGRAVSKEDVVPLLRRTGPLQVFRERGRNVYPYCDADKKTVDGWLSELFAEGEICTVFLGDPHAVPADEAPYYAAAARKEREVTDADRKVLAAVGEGTMKAIAKAAGVTEDEAFRSLRKLESMHEVNRVGYENNAWVFARFAGDLPDRGESIDRVVSTYLGCYAPATVHEVAYALSLTEDETRLSLEAMTAAGGVAKGRFLVSESDQYMNAMDRMRLRSGADNVYDFETVDSYRGSKFREFGSIREYFEVFSTAGSVLDVYNRVRDFDLNEWKAMRESGELVLGRFVRGRVRYALAEDAARYAKLCVEPILPQDGGLLDVIRGMRRATARQIAAATGMDRDELRESLSRLDRALRIVRAFDENEDWGSENVYEAYDRPETGGDPLPGLVARMVRAHGPMPPIALRYLLGIPLDLAEALAAEAGAERIYVGAGQAAMLVMGDEIRHLEESRPHVETVRVLSLHDPDIASKWAEIAARYGDRWIYPLARGGSVVGALEIWEMSGCVEIRGMDMDSSEVLPEVLAAVDDMMSFFRMKGTDVVRIREILSVDAAELDDAVAAELKGSGYHFVNGFYAKGNFVPHTFAPHQLVAMAMRRQRAAQGYRYRTFSEAIRDRGYVRNDAEMMTRIQRQAPIKAEAEAEDCLRASLLPGYVGYATREYAALCRDVKWERPSADEGTVTKVVADRQPVRRKEIVDASPLSEEATVDALNALFKRSAIAQLPSGEYVINGSLGLSPDEALREAIRRHFEQFGVFSAEDLGRFVDSRMGPVRAVLADLEAEGFLVKGFFEEGSPVLRWMLAEEEAGRQEPISGITILNSQDNLHVYLREGIRRETGGSRNVIMSGPSIIGSFDGKLTVSGAKVENFEGSARAERALNDAVVALGHSILGPREKEDEDWDVSEFYLRINPGAK